MNLVYLIVAGVSSVASLGTAIYTVYFHEPGSRSLPGSRSTTAIVGTASQRAEDAKKKRTAVLTRS